MGNITNRYPRLLASVIALLAAQNAWAQTIPSAADPVKAADRFQERTTPRPNDPFTREAAQPQPEASQDTFILGGIRVGGMTVYPADHFAALYAPLVGKPVSVPQIRKLASRITDRYQAEGYALAVAYVPTQTVSDGGTVTIQVDEGRIGTVIFMGELPPDSVQNLVRGYVKRIRTQQPVKTDLLERYLLFVNDLPGNTARAILRPSAKDPGATDFVIYYKHKPVDAFAATDNRGSNYLGPWQHSAGASGNGLLGMDERISARVIETSPIEEMRYVDMQYEQPVGTEGTRLVTSASYARTRPGYTLKTSRVSSETVDVQTKVIHPMLRARLQNLYVRATLDLRNSKTDFAALNVSDDRVRSVRVGTSYDLADNYNGTTIVDAELSHGLDALGATGDGSGRSNPNAKHNYTKIAAEISRTQILPYDFSMWAGIAGQYAFDALLSPEQYLIGGPVYGTAYDPGELSGDHGAAGKIELRYGQSMNNPMIDAYQLYTYYDVGSVWRKAPVGEESKRDSLASFGVGVRTDFNENISGMMEIAQPLTRDPNSDPDGGGRLFTGVTIKN